MFAPITGMVPPDATRRVMETARNDATSTFGGGIDKSLSDLESYRNTAGTSAVSFAISHIPLAGPALAKIWDVASAKGLDKFYETLRSEAKTRDDRILYTLFMLERSLAASLRQAYYTVRDYDRKATIPPDCEDCQEAFREARSAYLAQDCLDDLRSGCAMLATLVQDLEAEVGILKGKVDGRVTGLAGRIDDFRHNHKKASCMGLRTCYWVAPPGNVTVPRVGQHIGNDDL